MSGRSNGSNRFGEPSGFETSRDFAASREEYAFDDEEREGSEAEEEDDITEYSRMTSYSDSADYYSLLGLSRNPPPSDGRIRAAFHTLSLSFHPDKQPIHMRASAREQYTKIQRAYDTLIDPQKRVVYDLLGEDGVRAEWKAGGVMGKDGEGQDRRVGVRAMTPAEFRRWFLAAMKRRERDSLEEMVGSQGRIGTGVDASPFFVPLFSRLGLLQGVGDENSKGVRLTTFQVEHNFRAPLSWLTGTTSSSPNPSRYDGAPKESQIVLHGSLGGVLGYQEVEGAAFPGLLAPRIPFLVSRAPNLSLGSTFWYFVPEAPKRATPMRSIWSLMQGSALKVEASLLDTPRLEVTMHQRFAPIAGTSQFLGRLGLNFVNNAMHFPPLIDMGLGRSLGNGHEVFCAWRSGSLAYHSLPPVAAIIRFLRSIFGPRFTSVPEFSPRSFSIGYASQSSDVEENPGSPSAKKKAEEDENDDLKTERQPSSRPNWRFILSASDAWFARDNPISVGLLISHSRNIFGESADAASLSSWSAEDYHAPAADLGLTPQANPVRLEIDTSIRLDMSMNVTVAGTRKIGQFTRMGLGVSFGNNDMVSMLVTWSRLGQSLEFPIIVCPSDLVNSRIIEAAVLLPLATFAVFEFGFLRPRARREWQKALEKRRKELVRRVAEKRADSAQAIELMTSQVRRRQNEEAANDGLVIIHAEYGVPRSSRFKKKGKSIEHGEFIDVTVPVAGLVNEGQLSISRHIKKSLIVGFYDPAPLRRKTLRVRYRFGGDEHFVEVQESENLVCPMKEHKVSTIHDLE